MLYVTYYKKMVIKLGSSRSYTLRRIGLMVVLSTETYLFSFKQEVQIYVMLTV